jgi:hypothetical protein
MNKSRLERLAPLTGAIAVVLMLVPLGGATDYQPAADRAVEIFNIDPILVIAKINIGLLSAFFLMWFAGSVYTALREWEGGTGRVSLVAFGGGLATGVALAARNTVLAAGFVRAGAPGGISPEGAVMLYDLSGSMASQMAATTLAVLIGATSIVSLRKAMFPSWFGWASALITLGLLSPIAPIAFFLALVWLLVVSIWLYRRGAASSVSADPALGTT